jgi:SAM-dependent methyltransferase
MRALRAVRPHVYRRTASERASVTQQQPRTAAASSRRESLGGLALLLGTGALASFPRASFAAQAKPAGASDILRDPGWPDAFPFGPAELARYDESDDTEFYSAPRFVTHIDDAAIAALTKYYAEVFPPSGSGAALLDVCSSWISHYPKGYQAGRVVGLGMNEAELKRNAVLNEYTVRDLNKDPRLPYADNSFDVVTNCVSVDYLTKPLEVMKEVQRVLKPGGLALMSFSNRCFPTKAIAIWTSTSDLDHIWIVGSYFHFSGGFAPPEAVDISPKGLFGKSDPMYVVFARKLAA